MTHNQPPINREQLVRSLFDNMSAIKRGLTNHMQNMNRDCPISMAQLELLFTIRQRQPISFKLLAQQLYLTPGAISQLVENLEEHGFVARHSEEQDRRVQLLNLSPSGEKLLRTVEKRREGVMSDVIDDLSDNELAVWLRVQEKILQRLQSEATNHPKQETK